MTTTIRRVGVLSVAKIVGVSMTIMGLIFGLIFACFAILGTAAISSMSEEIGLGGFEGIVGALLYAVCFPILYGIMGFIFGALYALIYNAAASIIGGIELQLEGPAPVAAKPITEL